MSWLLIVILILTAFSVVQGIRKGLIRSVVSTFFMIFAVAIAVLIVPYLDRFLDEYSQLPEYIQKNAKCFYRRNWPMFWERTCFWKKFHSRTS